MTLCAMARPNVSAPGCDRRRKIVMGSVGASGRTMNEVAPNSPSETANAKATPTSAARRTIGRSISRHTRQGAAPSTEAASRRRERTLRISGTAVRTTKGTAIRA